MTFYTFHLHNIAGLVHNYTTIEPLADGEKAVNHAKKLFRRHRDLALSVIRVMETGFSDKSVCAYTVQNEGSTQRHKLVVASLLN